MATLQANAHAVAMAMAAGHLVGNIISIQEGSAVSISPIVVAGVSSSPSTSITPSLIQVQATVVLQAQLN
jgi:hypothetical protein